jgi:putative nucleotidyltransferase with HDIG domain
LAKNFFDLSVRARVFVAAVSLAGCATLAYSLAAVTWSPSRSDWLLVAGLTLVTGSFTVKVPSVNARISVSEAFVFAAVLLYGPEVATIIVALDTLVVSLWLGRTSRSAFRALFNMAAGTVAIWLSAHAFFRTIGNPSPPVNVPLDGLLVPLAVLSTSYFTLNSAMVAIVVASERSVSAFLIWRTNFLWLSLNYLGGASVAGLLASYTRGVDLTTLGLILPLLLITYLTFRTSMGRLEDATKHVIQLNELYLSAIETLAMAVDAKDQITHGHIRRVQTYATELARRMGVTDDRQLKAIEAAALLHDMGKLAIPEHILNKPGKLSSAEFEKMKRHADIGADLLSSIPFPYPVTPIVRHHHENWDGSGYPNGISGADIPLGSRILSVVDCFDALTSDRPYRPRLTDDAAFQILRERRGIMYDPLAVDTFIGAFDAIAPLAQMAGRQARSLLPVGIHEIPISKSTSDEIRAGSAHTATLAEARRVFAKTITPEQACSILAQLVRQMLPAGIAGVYTYLPDSDVLRCTHTSGDPNRALFGLEIPKGERTTGWVAANGSGILNSSAALDLGHVREHFPTELQSAMSIPLQASEQLIGVLTVYSFLPDPFTEYHLYLAEQVSALFIDRWLVLEGQVPHRRTLDEWKLRSAS